MGRIRRGFLWVLKNTLNRLTSALARRGRGPFSLIRNVGRKSGATYETPVILAQVPQGFVAELTYGPTVNWYRNIEAAGGCTVVRGDREFAVSGIEPMPSDAGLAAYGAPASWILGLLHRTEFRLLRVD
jgi:deazaflavin-dependent oxidoreductase (nitroreductase family)